MANMIDRQRRPFVAVVAVLVLAIATGCSGTPLGIGVVSLSPPPWIIGTWVDDMSILHLTVSHDNIVHTTDQGAVSYREAFRRAAVTEPVRTESEYRVQIVADGETQTLRFVSTSSTTLEHTVTYVGMTIGPVPLRRQ